MNLDSYFKEYEKESLLHKKALVTGATSGIGLATACALAQAGADLWLVGRREERLIEISEYLKRKYPHQFVGYIAEDVRYDTFFQKLRSMKAFEVDILINNAGLALGLDFIEDARVEQWREMVETNLLAASRMMQEVLPFMKEQKYGHIVNIGSIAGHESYEKGSMYCATKHALLAFVKALRLETCEFGVRVSTISPGLVETEFSEVRFSGDKERAKKVYEGMHPLTDKDVAYQVMYALTCPRHVNVDEILVLPQSQGSATKVFRKV